jgi:DNA-binding NarL/FixJ family response regulator
MKRISCLIFDDELCSLEILQNYVNQISILQIEGYFINPLEGLAIAKKSPPDLIISDLNMPQLSGVQLWTELHQHSWFIFQSGFPDWISQTMGNKVIDTLYKPFSFNRFQSAIEKAEVLIDLEIETKTTRRKFDKLTPTEQAVIKHIGGMKQRSDVAEEIFRSVKTIDRHRENIRNKLEFANKNELLEFAFAVKKYLCKNL